MLSSPGQLKLCRGPLLSCIPFAIAVCSTGLRVIIAAAPQATYAFHRNAMIHERNGELVCESFLALVQHLLHLLAGSVPACSGDIACNAAHPVQTNKAVVASPDELSERATTITIRPVAPAPVGMCLGCSHSSLRYQKKVPPANFGHMVEVF